MENTLGQLINHIFDIEIENAQLKRQLDEAQKLLTQLQERLTEINTQTE